MKLALGTVQFGLPYGIANQQGQVGFEETRAILSQAERAGLDTLDTAVAYGESERRLGEIGVGRWNIISKLPAIPEGCPDVSAWVDAEVQASLQRLRIPRLRGLLLHRPLQLLEEHGEELYIAINQLKDKGLVQKLGVSIYDPAELDTLFVKFKLDMVQAPFNILDRRLINSGWLNRLHQAGIEVHARSIFLQGLLLMSSNDRPQKFCRWQSLWNCWDEWLKETKMTPLQACLSYALSPKAISKAVIGVDNLGQFKQILQAIEGPVFEIPDALSCADANLFNPLDWERL